MSNSANNISRRDWFRLKLNRREPTLGQGDKQQLKPVEHPPNHDGMDLSELPPMREALLNSAQVELLFGDIGQHGSDIQLFARSSPGARATIDQSSSLLTAKQAILDSTVKRIQIRYRWQNSLWIDTLESSPEGYRLIRIAHAGR